MADWIATHEARKSAPSTVAVARQAAKFVKVRGFYVRDDPSVGLWVSNGLIGVAFDRGGNVVSLFDHRSRSEYVKSPDARPIWRLDFFRGRDRSMVKDYAATYAEPKENVIPLDAPPTVGWDVKTVRGGLCVTFTYDGLRMPGTVGHGRVETTLRLAKGDPMTCWRIAAQTTFAAHGLAGVRFPCIAGLGSKGENDFVRHWGSSGLGRLYRNAGNAYAGHYPYLGWEVQHLSLGFGDTALYLACHDGEGHTKSYYLEPGKAFYFAHYPANTGLATSYTQPYDAVVGSIAGDWYDSARRYAKWATEQKWCARGPLTERGDLFQRMIENDLWVRPSFRTKRRMLLPKYRLGGREEQVLANVAFFGSDIRNRMLVWWYVWYRENFDDDTPQFTPHPEAPPIFRKEARQGMVVMPYIQAWVWDDGTDLFRTEGVRGVSRYLDGTWKAHKWVNCSAAQMCPGSDVVRQRYVELTRNLKSYGANAAYLDCFGGGPHDCYCSAHGHPLGIGGNWWARAARGILADVREAVGDGFGLTGELFCEPLMDKFEAQLVSAYDSWLPVEEVPLLPAIYGRFAAFADAPTHGGFPDGIVAFRVKRGRALLWGKQLGGGMFSEYLEEDAKAHFMKRLLDLRQRNRRFLAYGQISRPPRFAEPLPKVVVRKYMVRRDPVLPFKYDAVEASAWTDADGTQAVFVVNYDDRPHCVRLRAWTDASLSAHDSADAVVKLTRDRGWVSVSVPQADAVVIRP